MEKDNLIGQIKNVTKVVMLRTAKKDMEISSGQTPNTTRVSGRMVSNMVKVKCLKMEK